MTVLVLSLAVAVPLSLITAQPVQLTVHDDPCTAVPSMPREVAEYYAASTRARQSGQALPSASPDGFAIYTRWNEALLRADYAYLCRYEAANKTLPEPTADRIVFMGDSITEAWIEYRPDFFKGDRVDRGIGGQTTQQMLARFYADVILLRPAMVHILAGTNDIANGVNAERIQNNIRAMVELAKAHRIKVILGTLTPAAQYNWRPQIDAVPAIFALNAWVREYARDHRLELVDYFAALDDGQSGLSPNESSDGVHPSVAGYIKMEAVLKPKLRNVSR